MTIHKSPMITRSLFSAVRARFTIKPKFQRFVIGLLIVSVISSCGFRLRGDYLLAPELQTLYVSSVDTHGELTRVLKRHLELNQVTIVKSFTVAHPELHVLKDANEEIKALGNLDTKTIAITSMNSWDSKGEIIRYQVDSTATIQLKAFKPNYLKYQSNTTNDGFAVFSEVYYKNGWNAYIDGNLVPHTRVNYVLRGLEIPKGSHTITFKFEPQVVKTGSTIALASSVIFGILLLLGLFYTFKTNKFLSSQE